MARTLSVFLLIGTHFGMVRLGAVTLTLTPIVQAAVDRRMLLPIYSSRTFEIKVLMDRLLLFVQIFEFVKSEDDHVCLIRFNLID